jgi:hypothetical protein
MATFSSKRGIIYIVFGEAFVKEALFSAESVKKFSPGIPVAFYTDIDVDSPHVDYKYLITDPSHVRVKVDYISRSPFEETIYLDSDICVVRDISDMFDILKKYDIAAIHDFARKREKYSKLVPEYDEIPYSFSEVNGGVFAFKRNDRTERFFELWNRKFYENYKKTSGWDQVSLRIALWQSDVNLYILPIEYNVRGKDNREKIELPHVKADLGEGHMQPRILHMHASKEDKTGKVKGIHRGIYDIETFEEFYEFYTKNHYRY